VQVEAFEAEEAGLFCRPVWKLIIQFSVSPEHPPPGDSGLSGFLLALDISAGDDVDKDRCRHGAGEGSAMLARQFFAQLGEGDDVALGDLGDLALDLPRVETSMGPSL